jgi:hypothetical protein
MHVGLQIKPECQSRCRRAATMVKFVHRREIIWIEPIWIFPRLAQRGKNSLFESAFGVLTRDIRFNTHDVPLPDIAIEPPRLHAALGPTVLSTISRMHPYKRRMRIRVHGAYDESIPNDQYY